MTKLPSSASGRSAFTIPSTNQPIPTQQPINQTQAQSQTSILNNQSQLPIINKNINQQISQQQPTQQTSGNKYGIGQPVAPLKNDPYVHQSHQSQPTKPKGLAGAKVRQTQPNQQQNQQPVTPPTINTSAPILSTPKLETIPEPTQQVQLPPVTSQQTKLPIKEEVIKTVQEVTPNTVNNYTYHITGAQAQINIYHSDVTTSNNKNASDNNSTGEPQSNQKTLTIEDINEYLMTQVLNGSSEEQSNVKTILAGVQEVINAQQVLQKAQEKFKK